MQNGFISALPFLCQWIVKIVVSVAVDQLKTRTKIRYTRIAVVSNSIGRFKYIENKSNNMQDASVHQSVLLWHHWCHVMIAHMQ